MVKLNAAFEGPQPHTLILEMIMLQHGRKILRFDFFSKKLCFLLLSLLVEILGKVFLFMFLWPGEHE